MRRGKQIYDWFPLWSDKWLFGSTRHELTHEQRAIWTDLMAVGNKDDGFIRANETTGYPMEQLAGLLCCSKELLETTIKICIEKGKLEDKGNGIYYICNWENYQLSGRYKRLIAEKAEQASEKTDASNLISSSLSPLSLSSLSSKDNEKIDIHAMASEIVAYLNTKADKNFDYRAKETFKQISARIGDGRTIENFRRVIDIKVAKWKGKSWKGGKGDTVIGDDLLRPSTLFTPTNFENYLNESMPGEKKDAPSKFDGIGEEI